MTSRETKVPDASAGDEARQSVAGEEDPGAAAADAGLRTQENRIDDLMQKKALNRWENEGGAKQGAQATSDSLSLREAGEQVDLTNTELVQLQLRVIALENLVIALLAGASKDTSELARAIAANISPRPGSTPHHLTIRAAAQMVHLLERATISKDALA